VLRRRASPSIVGIGCRGDRGSLGGIVTEGKALAATLGGTRADNDTSVRVMSHDMHTDIDFLCNMHPASPTWLPISKIDLGSFGLLVECSNTNVLSESRYFSRRPFHWMDPAFRSSLWAGSFGRLSWRASQFKWLMNSRGSMRVWVYIKEELDNGWSIHPRRHNDYSILAKNDVFDPTAAGIDGYLYCCSQQAASLPGFGEKRMTMVLTCR
jgi:hypothetical protein